MTPARENGSREPELNLPISAQLSCVLSGDACETSGALGAGEAVGSALGQRASRLACRAAQARFALKRPRLSLRQIVPALAFFVALLSQVAPARAVSAIEAALDATLVLYTDDLDEAFLGSGFLYADGTIAVSNQHVVGEARSVELRSRDGRRLSAPVIARDAARDIALIAVEGAALGPGLPPAPGLPELGAPVFALGAPLGEEFTVTRGMISATGRQILESAPVRYLQHDAAVNPGSSGGPLVDRAGRLIGMNSAIADGSRLFVGIGYAMTQSDIERLTGLMLAGELRAVPKLGLRLRPVSRRIAAALNLPEGEGLLIDAVASGSLAERAGLLPGDVLISVAGCALLRAGDLAFCIEARSGDLTEAIVLRAGQRVPVMLNLSAPAPVLAKLSSGGTGPARVERYSFASLGIVLDGAGQVGALNPGSPAAHAGLAAGDLVLAVNGAAADGIDFAAYPIEGPLVILVQRGDATLHVIVDPWGKGRANRPIGGANVLDPDVGIF